MTDHRTPYPEESFTEPERWAEQEAQFAEKMIESITDSLRQQHERLAAMLTGGRPHIDYINLTTRDMHDAALRLNTWALQADQFRRPRISRIENERRYHE